MFGNGKFLEAIKKKLEARRDEITRQLEEVAQKSSRDINGYEAKFPKYGRAEDENADEVAAFSDSLSLEGNLTDSLRAVELALKKLSENKYGVCEKCGRKIDRKRLEAFPTAKYCLACKSSTPERR